MSKLIIIQNTTQDLLRLSPDEIMYIQSDGNYCQLWLYGREEPVQLWISLKAVSGLIDVKKDKLTLWRKGMDMPIVLDGISHKALSALADGLLNDK